MTFKRAFRKNVPFLFMNLPIIVMMLLFNFLPMFGLIIAFKDFRYSRGVFGSEWAGIKYFKNIFEMPDIGRVIVNNLLYGTILVITGIVAAVVVGLLLYEISSRKALKIYQTAYNLPNFISFVLVAYIGFTLFSHEYGVINQILSMFGAKEISWYSEPKYWGVILTLFHIWKSVGVNALFYYAALMSVDNSLLEAAALDGASYSQRVRYVLIPSILPVICVFLVLNIGSVMGGGFFDLFFQVPMNSRALYPVTDIIDTYVYRGLTGVGGASVSQPAAVTFFQSVCSCVLVLGSNLFVRKVSPENAPF